ncbi:MAG: S24 family peptidase [Candidatus Ventricola sp.]|nr:S24 family peptidase [Candidatus Ventricola sp.]
MTTGERIKKRREAIGMTVDDVAAEIGKNRATVYRYENGYIGDVPVSVLSRLADILCTTPAYLMGWKDDPEDYEKADELNYLPQGWMEHFDGDVEAAVKAYRAVDEDRAREAALPPGALPVTIRRVPLLGNIACGEPILAESDLDTFAVVGNAVKCDFALRCQGDSMINARIYDGDVVFIKKQEFVDDGTIAAVLIDDEATLKRVYKLSDGRIELRAENPVYKPIMVGGEGETRTFRVLGKAVAFQSTRI